MYKQRLLKMFNLLRLSRRQTSRLLVKLLCVVFIAACLVLLHKQNATRQQPQPHVNEQELEDLRVKKRAERTFIDVESWLHDPTVGCQGNFYGYGEEFVRLHYARIHPQKGFYVACDSDIPKYSFQFGREGTPLQGWVDTMNKYSPSSVNQADVTETVTVVIMRIEAHNLYHTMCEWYNVFILSKLLKFNPSEVNILFLDERPQGHMDETWTTLFKNIIKYSQVEQKTTFKDLIWNAIGYESPMNHHFIKTPLPYLRDFRRFFLDSFDIKETKTLDCRELTVTLMLRRDYMTHPERLNMTGGLVHRKFQNEEEILKNVKFVFSSASINVIILEELSMNEQLRIITNTDVLIGMHGAAMTHILFLPRHAVVFEMFPKYWGFFHHFKAIARWQKLKYYGWQNQEVENEFPDFNTRIPPNIVRFHCYVIKSYLCGGWNYHYNKTQPASLN